MTEWTPPERFECLKEAKFVTVEICERCEEKCRKRRKEKKS